MIDNAKTPSDYSTLQMEDFKNGMIIEGYLPYNYGAYEFIQSESDSGNTTYDGEYFLIDAGDEGFMGLYTPDNNLMSQLEKQSDDFYNYVNLVSDEYPESIYFKGKVRRMDSEDVSIYHSFMTSWGYTQEEIDETCLELYIEVKDISSSPALLAIGSVVALGGVLFCILFVKRKLMGR